MVLQFQDLARAFVLVLGNEKASKQVFNISGDKYITFDGLAKACAKVIVANIYPNALKKKTLWVWADMPRCYVK